MPTDSLVSTIIPVHNRAAMAKEAVESVLAQSHRPIEILVVDDGSNEETAETLRHLAGQHIEVRLVQRENGGPGAARETGRVLARGAFVQYLDSDDILLPGKFSAQLSAFAHRPECGVSYGMTRFRQANGECVEGPWKGSGKRVETMFPSFLESRWWDTPNPLYRRELCDRAGPWLQTYMEEDWEYDCRIASFGAPLAFVAEYVCEVRDHSQDRLSRYGLAPERLKDRALAHARIYAHARTAGIGHTDAAMQRFSRALFLLARQCGAASLECEAETLFNLARQASGERRANGADFQLFSLATKLVGWRRAGRLACELDRLRS